MWPDKLLFIHSRAKKVKYKKRLLIKKKTINKKSVSHCWPTMKKKKKKKKTHVGLKK